jgi:hypothetical protein
LLSQFIYFFITFSLGILLNTVLQEHGWETKLLGCTDVRQLHSNSFFQNFNGELYVSTFFFCRLLLADVIRCSPLRQLGSFGYPMNGPVNRTWAFFLIGCCEMVTRHRTSKVPGTTGKGRQWCVCLCILLYGVYPCM